MQIYDIRKSNLQVHLWLEQDIVKLKDGLLTFTIRVNNGDITDYIVMEYESYGEPTINS